MSKRLDLQLRKEAAKRAAEFATRFGANITEQKQRECFRAGQLCAIADLIRDRALSSGEVDFDKLKQAEQMAEAAVLSLGFPRPAGAVDRIEVELVPSKWEWQELEEQVAALKAKLAAYESGLNLSTAAEKPVGEISNPPSVTNVAALPPPSNVVPLNAAPKPPAETDDERIRRRRREAGDVTDTGWQRSAFDGGLGGLCRDGPGVAWQSGDLLTRLTG